MTSSLDLVVISGIAQSERRAAIQSKLDSLGLTFIFFDAFYPREMSASVLDSYRAKHRPAPALNEGEFGCYLSHFYAIQAWAQAGESEYLLIMEDDAQCDQRLVDLCSALSKGKLPDFDLLKLGGLVSGKRKRTAISVGTFEGFHVVYPLVPAFGAEAYVINRRVVARLLKHMVHFDCLNDDKIFKRAPLGLTTVEVAPFIVTQDITQTTIFHVFPTERKTLFRRLRNDLGHALRTLRMLLGYIIRFGAPLRWCRIR
jgi:GR25 family glycosyltransferase involved in LPS biosynthesis